MQLLLIKLIEDDAIVIAAISYVCVLIQVKYIHVLLNFNDYNILIMFAHFYFTGEYSLAPGVYLLLGFSSQDEALLRPHTRLGLEDAVRILQEYMVSLAEDGVIYIYNYIQSVVCFI